MKRRLTHFSTLGIVLIAFSVMPPVLSADEGDDLYNLSLGLIRQERYETAAETLEKLVTQFPKHSRTELARFRLGVIHLTLKNFEPARKNLRQFAANNKQSKNLPEALYHIGYSSFQLGDMKAAEQEFQTFHQQFPDHPSREKSLAYLGYAQLQNQKASQALETFKSSLVAFPQGTMREDVLWGQANALIATGKTQSAIDAYSKIAENPTGVRNDQALMKLGQLFYEQSEFTESATRYSRLAKEFPKSRLAGTARMNAGYAFFQGKQYEQAKEQFATAAKAGVQRPMALYWQGLSEKSLGELDSAVDSLAASAELVGKVPAAAPIIFQWADALLKLGKYADAREQFLASQQVDPKADTADDSLYLAAESALLLADLESATSLLNRMDEEYPESGLTGYQKLLRGQIDVRQGSKKDLNAAEDTFRELLNHKNESLAKLSRFHLARCLEKQDRCIDALAELEPLLPLLTPESSSELFEAYLIAAECHRRLAMTAHLEARPLRKQVELVGALPSEDAAAELNQRIEQLSTTATNRAKQALASLQQYLKLKPAREGFADVLQIQAIGSALAADEEKTAAALAKMREGAAEPALAAKLYFETAEIAYDLGKYSWASRQFETLATFAPQETWRAVALSGLGWSYYKLDQFQKSAEVFATIVAEESRNDLAPEAAFMQAEALRKADQLPAAQQQFAKTFEMFAPTAPVEETKLSGPATFARRGGLESARLLKALNKIPEADLAYETVIERFPNLPGMDRLLSEWAVMNANADRFERSDRIFQRLLTENPNSPAAANARLSLAESSILSGNPTAARTQLQTLIKNQETESALLKRAFALLIRIEITAGNWKSVDDLGAQFQARYPEDDFRNDADFYRAEALLNQNKPADAGKILNDLYRKRDQEEVQNSSWFARLWVLMAEVAIRQKNYERVFQLSDEMNDLEATKPFRYQLQEITGRAYKNKARFAEAIAAFEAVTTDEFGEKTQTAAKSQFLIGETLLLQKKYKPALEAYLKVYLLYQFPQWQAPALFQAGQCDEALEQWQKALTSYEDLLRDFPNSEYAAQAKRRITEVKPKVK